MNRASKPVYTNIGVRGNGFLLLTLANYFFSYAKPTPKSAIKKGEYHSPPFISVSASVNPKPIAKKSIPISLHRGSTLFFLNHSICYFLLAASKNPPNERARQRNAIPPIPLVRFFPISSKNSYGKYAIMKKIIHEKAKTFAHTFCIPFIAKFNQY